MKRYFVWLCFNIICLKINFGYLIPYNKTFLNRSTCLKIDMACKLVYAVIN